MMEFLLSYPGSSARTRSGCGVKDVLFGFLLGFQWVLTGVEIHVVSLLSSTHTPFLVMLVAAS
jgi:hypothetical protein